MDRVLANTVELIDDGRISCSGFVMEGAVITAAHCVEGDFYVTIRTADGDEHRTRVVRIDVVQDYAALKPVDGWKPGKGIPLARRAPGYGDDVFAFGHSGGDDYPYSLPKGIGGNSGGPVLNKRGHVVGITSFGALSNAICSFDCRGLIMQRTHISGAVHYDSLVALLASR